MFQRKGFSTSSLSQTGAGGFVPVGGKRWVLHHPPAGPPQGRPGLSGELESVQGGHTQSSSEPRDGGSASTSSPLTGPKPTDLRSSRAHLDRPCGAEGGCSLTNTSCGGADAATQTVSRNTPSTCANTDSQHFMYLMLLISMSNIYKTFLKRLRNPVGNCSTQLPGCCRLKKKICVIMKYFQRGHDLSTSWW